MTRGEDGAASKIATHKPTAAVDDGMLRTRRGGRAQRRASAPTIDPGSNHYVEPDASGRAVSINDFELIHMLGSGGVGNVWYGVERRSRQPYAVKIIEKHQILGQTSLTRVLAEREIMTMLRHPFIVNLHHAMQDDTRIFFVLDYMRCMAVRACLSRSSERFPLLLPLPKPPHFSCMYQPSPHFLIVSQRRRLLQDDEADP